MKRTCRPAHVLYRWLPLLLFSSICSSWHKRCLIQITLFSMKHVVVNYTSLLTAWTLSCGITSMGLVGICLVLFSCVRCSGCVATFRHPVAEWSHMLHSHDVGTRWLTEAVWSYFFKHGMKFAVLHGWIDSIDPILLDQRLEGSRGCKDAFFAHVQYDTEVCLCF